MKVLVTGNYDPSYNRTQILLKGLNKCSEVTLTEFPIPSLKKLDKNKFKQLAQDSDFIYLPPFTHESVKKIKKLTNRPIIFDPLISKYLTKVYDYQQVSKYSPRAYKNYLKDKIPLTQSDLIIADTESHKNYFVSKFKIDPKKIVVLPIGADLSQFKLEENPKNSIFNVGFYGGFIPLQGVTHIIETAKLLENEKDIHFNLIGTGFELEKIKKLAGKFHLKNVSFLGWVEYKQLPLELNKFDICMGIFGDSPKADIVIPNKIYHYAALGKCIISKETDAIKEVFTNNLDIILSSNNPSEIAQHILNLKQNPASYNKIGSEAHALIHKHYNQDKIAEKFLSFLKNFSSRN
jgi:glycosyltransferase involved in cell wall biosynthesis